MRYDDAMTIAKHYGVGAVTIMRDSRMSALYGFDDYVVLVKPTKDREALRIDSIHEYRSNFWEKYA